MPHSCVFSFLILILLNYLQVVQMEEKMQKRPRHHHNLWKCKKSLFLIDFHTRMSAQGLGIFILDMLCWKGFEGIFVGCETKGHRICSRWGCQIYTDGWAS